MKTPQYKKEGNRLVLTETVEKRLEFAYEDLVAERNTYQSLVDKHEAEAQKYRDMLANAEANLAKATQLGVEPTVVEMPGGVPDEEVTK